MQRNRVFFIAPFFISTFISLVLALLLAGCTATSSQAPGAEAAAGELPANQPAHPTSAAPLDTVAQAEQLYAEARFEPARQAFRHLAGQFPRNAYFWFRLGNCSMQLKRYVEAAQAFEQARLLDPSDGRFAYNLALVHSTLARDAFLQARLQLPPHSPWRLEAEQNRRLLEAVVGAPAR